ncbi:MAG TPA: response regulator transcription factor [Candidatus Angelobacter sp.]|nr:response regulator transcription factor [Candidatus Angelobacter sp.]
MRILLVEDQRKVANFVARALRENAYAVDLAESGEAALQMMQDATYDVMLLDVRLPGMSGIEVCQKLRQWGNETHILMLTARGLLEHRVEGLDAGADDYLTKPFEIEELLARVRALIRRASHSRGNLTFADLVIDRRRRRVLRAGHQVALTLRELSLLELLLSRSPETVPRTEIIGRVWDCNFDSETNLLEVYINRLRQKVDLPGRTKLIHTVRGLGYRLGLPE